MSRSIQIANALIESGWTIVPLELASDCWWAKEIWELRSNWTPKDTVTYLSLLVDPMAEIDSNNISETVVWAIGLSRNLPEGRLEAEGLLIPIKRRISFVISEIVTETNKMRMVR